MDIYVARQPVFDRNMHVYGYELLYRKSMNNFYEGTDDNQSTFELISNAFLTMHLSKLTGGSKAFINFPKDMLLQNIPALLPAKSIVVEVLERVEIDEDVVAACKRLREKGYIIALDDFIFDERYLPLLDVAHIIKVEFPAVGYDEQRRLIRKYKNRIRFLAEKVETREEYQRARDIGYDYFQGYFFCKPVVMKEREIPPLNANLIKILEILNHDDPEYRELAEVIETDLGLTYKLLRLANSVYFGSKYNIRGIRQALVQIGLLEIKKWVYLLIMTDRQDIENRELIRNCLIRAKFMELIAEKTGNGGSQFDYFLAGMFSSIDVLMNKDMADVLNEILLPDSIKEALLGQETPIKRTLDIAINYELLKLDAMKLDANILGENFDGDAVEYLVNIYMESITWVMHLGY
ncbi:EAL and modified HD-GYP domain-containing signal transduction protein [Anaerotaenia torta]|uniref:EAL and HDOD domain-containing protein n=1 Tax=Anaerotaenia torta TaxID=433293 RepID=UPI003D1FD16A